MFTGADLDEFESTLATSFVRATPPEEVTKYFGPILCGRLGMSCEGESEVSERAESEGKQSLLYIR